MADLTTLLSKFLNDLYSGTLGTTLPITAIRVGDGTAAAPAYSFVSDPDTGFFREGGALTHYSGNGVALLGFNGDSVQRQIKIHSGASLGWTAGDSTASLDLILSRDAANTLAQRNGVNPQELRIYTTYTDAANYTHTAVNNGAGAAGLFIVNAGTGVAETLHIFNRSNADIRLGTNNTTRWQINSLGHLVAFTDNTYDIGASGNKPRLVYTGASTVAALPASPATGARYVVTDSNATFTAGIGAVVAGGGANVVPVFYDGTNWRIG